MSSRWSLHTKKVDIFSELPPEMVAHILFWVTDLYDLLALRVVSRMACKRALEATRITHSTEVGRYPHPRVLVLFPHLRICQLYWDPKYVPSLDEMEIMARPYHGLVIHMNELENKSKYLPKPHINELWRWGHRKWYHWEPALQDPDPRIRRKGMWRYEFPTEWTFNPALPPLFERFITALPEGGCILFINLTSHLRRGYSQLPFFHLTPEERKNFRLPPELQ